MTTAITTMATTVPVSQGGCRQWQAAAMAASVAMLMGMAGCRDLAGNQPLPAGTKDPNYYNTPQGAVSMRNAAIAEVELEIPYYLTDAGRLTDELTSIQIHASSGQLTGTTVPVGGSLDERILPGYTSATEQTGAADGSYNYLQVIRGDVNQALGALAAYNPSIDPAVRGELYAMSAYAEVLLSDLYCSGVPLSTLDYNHDFTYHPSSRWDQVYQDALTKLDTALALSTDSARIENLSRVLRGRALLDLGRYPEAAQAVAEVPDAFNYQLSVAWVSSLWPNNVFVDYARASVADREGGNGYPYISSGDPRTTVVSIGTSSYNHLPEYFPAKYGQAIQGDGTAPFSVASGIEARLIQAEAALNAGDPSTFMSILNTLRLTTGGVPGLTQLSDPGTLQGRVALLFQERAAWLFLTGERQGDMRRLIRAYGWPQNQVYPVGVYTAPGAGQYGTDVNAPIPAAEFANPLFHGCLSRGA